MFPIHYFTGFAAIFLAAVAAYFSITGLGALYAAAFISIVIMGTAIEIGKLAGTFWLHKHWKAHPMSGTLVALTIVGAMAVTSGGVYGYLTKGHLDQESPIASTELKIERIDKKIASYQSTISRQEDRLSQLDSVVQKLIDFDKISGKSGANAVRESQDEERKEIQKLIDSASEEIDKLRDERLTYSQEVSTIEAKLGPVKFLAELFGLDPDKTVQYFTFLIVILLDPFAILLVVATSHAHDKYLQRKGRHPEKEIVEIEKIVEKVVEKPVEKIVEKIVYDTDEEDRLKAEIRNLQEQLKKKSNMEPKMVVSEVPMEVNESNISELLEDPDLQAMLEAKPDLITKMERVVADARRQNTGWSNPDGKLNFGGMKPTN